MEPKECVPANCDKFDVIADGLTCCDKSCPQGCDPAKKAAMPAGGLASVLRGLSKAGVPFADILKWASVAYQLFLTVGPQVTQIIQQILDAINTGKQPADVVGA